MDSPATTRSIAVVEQYVTRTHLLLDADADRSRVLSALSAQDESGRRQRLGTLRSLGGRRGAHQFPLSSIGRSPSKDAALPQRSATPSQRRNRLPLRPPGAEDQRHGIREPFQRAKVAFVSMVEDILSAKEESESDRQIIG